jgi:hypothetical protein
MEIPNTYFAEKEIGFRRVNPGQNPSYRLPERGPEPHLIRPRWDPLSPSEREPLGIKRKQSSHLTGTTSLASSLSPQLNGRTPLWNAHNLSPD